MQNQKIKDDICNALSQIADQYNLTLCEPTIQNNNGLINLGVRFQDNNTIDENLKLVIKELEKTSTLKNQAFPQQLKNTILNRSPILYKNELFSIIQYKKTNKKYTIVLGSEKKAVWLKTTPLNLLKYGY